MVDLLIVDLDILRYPSNLIDYLLTLRLGYRAGCENDDCASICLSDILIAEFGIIVYDRMTSISNNKPFPFCANDYRHQL